MMLDAQCHDLLLSSCVYACIAAPAQMEMSLRHSEDKEVLCIAIE